MMGYSPHRVLLAGDDERLLATRARVVGLLGVGVTICLLSEATARLKSEPFDLLVVAHSPQDPDAARTLAEGAKASSPGILVLILSRTVYLPERSEFGDLISPPDPPILLEQISKLLGIGGNLPRVPESCLKR